jgi:hypothetical protein
MSKHFATKKEAEAFLAEQAPTPPKAEGKKVVEGKEAKPPTIPPTPPSKQATSPSTPQKKTKLARRIEVQLNKEFEDSATYGTMNMADQARQADQLVTIETDRAWRILDNLEDAPAGLRLGSIYVAMREKAVLAGDGKALQRLRGPMTRIFSAYGQEIKSLDRPMGEDPIRAINSVESLREELADKKAGKKKSTAKKKKAAVKEMKTKMRDQAKVSKWEKFIRELQC